MPPEALADDAPAAGIPVSTPQPQVDYGAASREPRSGRQHGDPERAPVPGLPATEGAELAMQRSSQHGPRRGELVVRDSPVIAPHERHRRQPHFAKLLRPRAMEVSVATAPHTVFKVSSITPSRSIARQTLEVRLENEDIGPAVPQELFSHIDAIQPIDVEQRAQRPEPGRCGSVWEAGHASRVGGQQASDAMRQLAEGQQVNLVFTVSGVSIPISRTVISLLSARRATNVSPSMTRDTRRRGGGLRPRLTGPPRVPVVIAATGTAKATLTTHRPARPIAGARYATSPERSRALAHGPRLSEARGAWPRPLGVPARTAAAVGQPARSSAAL
jgi:hypothetical protein